MGLHMYIIGGTCAKNIATTVEAIMGAAYLDSGMQGVKDLINTLGLKTREQTPDRRDEAGRLRDDAFPPQMQYPPMKRQRSQELAEQDNVKRVKLEHPPVVKSEDLDDINSEILSMIRSEQQAMAHQSTSNALKALRDYSTSVSPGPS